MTPFGRAMASSKSIKVISINENVQKRLDHHGSSSESMMQSPSNPLDTGLGIFVHNLEEQNKNRRPGREPVKIREVETSYNPVDKTNRRMTTLMKKKPASAKAKIGDIL